jgi:hypothetical protein
MTEDIQEYGGTKIMFLTAEIDDKLVYYHEAVWTRIKGLINPGNLICHINGKTTENNIENLFEVEETKVNPGHRDTKDKIFHQDSYNEEFVKEHFPDVYENLNRVEILEEL